MKKLTRLLGLVLVLVLCLSVLPLNAAASQSGWQKDSDGLWHYYENDAPITGWRKISGVWYYFIPAYDGRMAVGWMNTDPKYYTDAPVDGLYTGDWYYFNEDGGMEAGKWVREVENPDSDTPVEHWYYLLDSGKGAMGWQKIRGVWYYFLPERDGEMACDEVLRLDDKLYCFDENGAMVTGWRKIDGDWLYFASNGAAVEDGWKKINGRWYYFYGSPMVTGLWEIDGDFYYFDENGVMQTGWVQFSDGSWGYFASSGAAVKEGWRKINGSWYYFENYGYYFGGSAVIDGEEYYFRDNGRMVTGWVHFFDVTGDYIGWAYYYSNGARVQNGRVRIDGTYYTFENGWMV